MSKNNTSSVMAEAIEKQVREFEQSEEFQAMIKKKVVDMMSTALDEALGRWSPFQKSVNEALKQAMPSDISTALDLTKYNTLLSQAIQNSWDSSAITDQAAEKGRELVLDFIQGFQVPKYITMTELINTFIEEHADEAAQEQWDRPHIFFKENYEGRGYIELGIEDHLEEPSRYSSSSEKKHAFDFSKNIYLSLNKDEEVDGHQVYHVFSGRLGDTPLGNSKIKTFYSDFDKLIAYMYYGGAKLVLDTTDFDDFTYPSYD